MKLTTLKNGDSGLITFISNNTSVKRKLLTNGICLGAIVKINYSPAIFNLLHITVNGRLLGIRKTDAENIEVLKMK